MSDERAGLIERYAAGAELIRDASEVVPFAEWDSEAIPGEWTARQILVHLADSEIVGAGRFRQLLAEDAPALYMYQQAAWAERLGYRSNADVAEALELGAALRRSTADLIRRVATEETWARTASHATRGEMDLERLLTLYVGHVEGHIEQLRALAAKLGG